MLLLVLALLRKDPTSLCMYILPHPKYSEVCNCSTVISFEAKNTIVQPSVFLSVCLSGNIDKPVSIIKLLLAITGKVAGICDCFYQQYMMLLLCFCGVVIVFSRFLFESLFGLSVNGIPHRASKISYFQQRIVLAYLLSRHTVL